MMMSGLSLMRQTLKKITNLLKSPDMLHIVCVDGGLCHERVLRFLRILRYSEAAHSSDGRNAGGPIAVGASENDADKFIFIGEGRRFKQHIN